MEEHTTLRISRSAVLAFAGAILATTICVVGAAVSAATLARAHHISTVLLALLAAGFTVGAVVLIRLSIHLEHGLRKPRHLATLYDLAPAPAGSAASGRRPKNGPGTRLFVLGLVTALLALLIWVSIASHANAVRSAYTQHHGVSRTGTVTQVHRIHHSTRSSSYSTYNYDVSLFQPVNGTSTTRVHDPSQDYHDFFVGDVVTVLVNPHQPGYAEIPGRPDASRFWWLAPVIIGGIFLFIGVFITLEQRRHRRHRLAAAATPPQPTPAPAA